MATTIKKTKEIKLITARELAEKAGVSPAVLRKLLRQEFNRTGKVTVEGNRSEYRFDPTSVMTKQIIERAKALKEKPQEPKEDINPVKSQEE